MKTIKIFGLILLVVLTVGLSACGEGRTAADTVEAYWQALVDKDPITAVTLSCLAWEEQARAEANSFEAVEVRLEDMDCTVAQGDEAEASVVCDGSIVANYGGEDTTISLADRSYLAIQEDGEWKMCGYGSR
ncbi:MAG: hypothetical protein JXA97_14065 [Anaerolineales bacterium]|nr:hypothetical protein [Anaerolineales bacterium]